MNILRIIPYLIAIVLYMATTTVEGGYIWEVKILDIVRFTGSGSGFINIYIYMIFLSICLWCEYLWMRLNGRKM